MHSIAQTHQKSKKKETHGLRTRSRPPKISAGYSGGAAAFGSRPEKIAGSRAKLRGFTRKTARSRKKRAVLLLFHRHRSVTKRCIVISIAYRRAVAGEFFRCAVERDVDIPFLFAFFPLQIHGDGEHKLHGEGRGAVLPKLEGERVFGERDDEPILTRAQGDGRAVFARIGERFEGVSAFKGLLLFALFFACRGKNKPQRKHQRRQNDRQFFHSFLPFCAAHPLLRRSCRALFYCNIMNFGVISGQIFTLFLPDFCTIGPDF